MENIHANGPIIFAQEIYVINGAQPGTTYQVTLEIYVRDTTCTSSPVPIPSEAITTNTAGNGRADAIIRPSDVPPELRNATHGIIWAVSDSSGTEFSSGCEAVTLD